MDYLRSSNADSDLVPWVRPKMPHDTYHMLLAQGPNLNSTLKGLKSIRAHFYQVISLRVIHKLFLFKPFFQFLFFQYS